MITKGVRVSTSPPDWVSAMNNVRTPRSSPSPNTILNSRRLNPTLSSLQSYLFLEIPQSLFHVVERYQFLAEHFCTSLPGDKCTVDNHQAQLLKNGTESSFFIHRFGQCLIAFSARASTYSLHLAGSFISRSILRMTSSSTASRAFISWRLRATSLKSLGGVMKLLQVSPKVGFAPIPNGGRFASIRHAPRPSYRPQFRF